jgi:biotin-(acetyl-CoA carboxylase) ligase
MPLASRLRSALPSSRSLDLPPPFRLVVLREVGDAFAHARTHAGELGAGTLVFVGRFDLAEFAVVLEPDQPLAAARLAFYAGMVALVDALAAAAPPEKPIVIEWPDAIQVDRGLVGGGRLAWPEGCDEAAVPDWLVFGTMIRTAALGVGESALHPQATALAVEGFDDANAERIVERFARHLMVAIDRWQEDGFAPVAQDYLAKLMPAKRIRHDIADNGDLLAVSPGEPTERLSLASALPMPSWFNPATNGPLLEWPPPARQAVR